jgi:hypothetical protein
MRDQTPDGGFLLVLQKPCILSKVYVGNVDHGLFAWDKIAKKINVNNGC